MYRGRDLVGGMAARPRSVGHMTDFSCDETDKGPPLQTHSLREFEQHLNDLKKENFSLKLRIYFLEERIQQKHEGSRDDVHRKNIELKVEVESLKQELQEKQQLLDDAVLTAEGLSNQNEAQLQRRCEEKQTEISHMQELLETKVQLLQEEAQQARGEAEKMASFVDSSSQRCLALEREMAEKMEECREALGPQQHKVLAEKDREIEKLTKENGSLSDLVTELEMKVQDLSSTLQRKEKDAEMLQEERCQENNHIQQEMQKIVDEQQSQLGQYENAAGQCVGELQKAQLQVHSLQAKIRESETRNQKLQVRLSEMEMELRSAREEAQRQERNILNLTDSVSTREAEAVELYRVIEEQSTMLTSLKELANRNKLQQLQMSGAESVRGQGEVLSLQASLFQAQLELQAGQRAQRQATRREEDLTRALERLEKDLQGALQHRRDTERHNQDLHLALEKARSALQEGGEQLKEQEGERKVELEDREETIKELRTLLQTKQQMAQEYNDLLEQRDPGEDRGAMLQRLRDRIKERDRALERAVDEKFRCVEEKEGECRRLQLLVREKERDLERQRCVLSNNEETITSLEALLRGKGLELEQVREAWRAAQRHHQEAEERQRRCLGERDALVGQFQAALHTSTTEVQELRSTLLARLSPSPSELLVELQGCLQLKEHLFQEVLSDRARQAQEHQAQVQELLHTITARDQHIQDSSSRLGEVMSEQTSRLQELRRQLSSTPQSPTQVSPALDPGCGSASSLELQTLQEELRLATKKEREAQEENHWQAAQLEALARTVLVNEGIVKDYQKQLVDPSSLPLVERLTQELQELRESLVAQDPARRPAIARDMPANRQAEYGGGQQRSMGRYL